MQHQRSRLEKANGQPTWLVVALGATLAGACATGVSVTDEECAEILGRPDVGCEAIVGGQVGSATGGTSGAGGTGGASTAFGGSSSGTGGAANNGGSFNSNGGTGGTSGNPTNGGTGGTGATTSPPQPLAEGECLASDDVVISYQDRKLGAPSTNEPSMVLSVRNNGDPFNLPELSIRYWFTADGASNFIGVVDYASVNGGDAIKDSVTVSFGEEFGSNYAQLGFTSGGPVASGGAVQQVQLRFHGEPYRDMSQANDFSFLSPAASATPNRNITPYVNGEAVGGCVPIP